MLRISKDKEVGLNPTAKDVCNPMDTQKCTEEKSRKGCVKCWEVRHEATRRRLFCKGCITLPRHGESDLCYSEVHLRLLQGADGTSREEDQRQPGARGQSDEHAGHQTDYKSLLVLLSYFCLLFSPTTLPSTCLCSLSPHPSIFRSISLSSLSFERQSEEEIYYVIKELPEDACIFPVRL
ncbi:fibroblast growth factor 9 isoform X2 [Panthera uncia]|uniref:fibroblast growth factor 9 isoform X2 n=1 Tax=Panthera uncia TaxID=29064 RepID=UPI0020FFCFEA|nr:fibroblast growth factor 9 isoform X2 [Panthera uncia]